MKTLARKIAAAGRKLVAVVNRGRTMHYVDIFAASFVVALGANEQHILGASGYDAWKSLVEAAAVVGAKAVFEAYRKAAFPAPPAEPVPPPAPPAA